MKRTSVLVALVVMLLAGTLAQADLVTAEPGEVRVSLYDRTTFYRPSLSRFLNFGEPVQPGDEIVTIVSLQPDAAFAWNPLTTELTGIFSGLQVGGIVDANTWLAPTAATTSVDIYFVPSGRYTGAHANGWVQIYVDQPADLLQTALSTSRGRDETDVNGNRTGTPALLLGGGTTPPSAGPFTDGTLFIDATIPQIPSAFSVFADNQQGGALGTHPFIGLGWQEVEGVPVPVPDGAPDVSTGIMYLDILGGSFGGEILANYFFPGGDAFLNFDNNTNAREGFPLGSDDPVTFFVGQPPPGIIPEPMTFLLLGIGAAGLGIARRKRRA